MSKRERLEVTFGEKDADLWQYLESFGLPKAALVKKMIREHKEGKIGTIQSSTQSHSPVQIEDQQVAKETKNTTEIRSSRKSPFGGLATTK